ncbi:MAG: metallophosphoesterase, partial [Muribaculaceae bacterium]|nr:metallophosphoesterase [Muribaculaceae bacterium]
MAFIFIICALLLLLPDVYILFCVIGKAAWWTKILFLLPTLAYFFVMIRMFVFGDMRQNMLNLLFWLTLCVVFPTVIFTVISLLGKGIGLFWHQGSLVFNWLASALSVVWLTIAIYGIAVGWKKVTVEEVTVTSSKIPAAFDGYRIVQLSDFHIGTYMASPETVERIVSEVNNLRPDLIVFTGDLVNSSSEEISPFLSVLSQFKARDGVYSVLGNHDYCLYRSYKAPDSPDKELAKVISLEQQIGWKLLRNESIQLTAPGSNDSIALIGVDNAGSRMFPDKSDLPKAVKDLPASEFKILLSHDPSHWRREVLPATDIDLTLSGHT